MSFKSKCTYVHSNQIDRQRGIVQLSLHSEEILNRSLDTFRHNHGRHLSLQQSSRCRIHGESTLPQASIISEGVVLCSKSFRRWLRIAVTKAIWNWAAIKWYQIIKNVETHNSEDEKEVRTMWSMCAWVMKTKSWSMARLGHRPISNATLSAGSMTHVSWPPTDTPSIENPSTSNAPVVGLPSFVCP